MALETATPAENVGKDGLGEMNQPPRIALVGWRLGCEFNSLIKQGHERFRYVVVSMVLPEEIRPLVEWHRIPLLRWLSFWFRWVIFFILGGLRKPKAIVGIVSKTIRHPITSKQIRAAH